MAGTKLTRRQAADHAGVDISTIDRWLRERKLSKHRTAEPGGRWRPAVFIDSDELDAYRKRQTEPVIVEPAAS